MNKQTLLLQSLKEFYDNDDNQKILSNILKRNGGISLRNIEWFITNYSKKRNVSYTTKEGRNIVVHCAYKSTLDGYSKKLFDPFCRMNKINYDLSNGETIQTTVAQLNFIRWCIKNRIIDYIVTNKEQILTDYSNVV